MLFITLHNPLCVDLFMFRVVIRGDPSEDAVLCTDDKTYELRIADTSNALLITPSLTLPKDPGKVLNHIILSLCQSLIIYTL